MSLSQNIINRLSPADRAALGTRTSAELRAAAMAKDERELQRQIASWLRLHGFYFDQDAMHRRRTGTTGAPDFQFPYRGRFVAWEVKTPWAAKLRPEQAEAAHRISLQGGEHRVITSLDEAKAHLRDIDGRGK